MQSLGKMPSRFRGHSELLDLEPFRGSQRPFWVRSVRLLLRDRPLVKWSRSFASKAIYDIQIYDLVVVGIRGQRVFPLTSQNNRICRTL